MGWSGAEAWIFVSIGDAAREGPATLDKVIGAADANNHAIPNVAEFEQAVGQLLGAGLITTTPYGYSLTADGRDLFGTINSSKRDRFARWIETAKTWQARAPSEAAPVSWTVDPGTFKEAFRRYNRWFSKTDRSLEKRRKGGRNRAGSS
jgi:hypothetical protein